MLTLHQKTEFQQSRIPWKMQWEKKVNAYNQHFLLFQKCFQLFKRQILSLMVSQTSLGFYVSAEQVF